MVRVNLTKFTLESKQKENVVQGYYNVQLHFPKIEDFSFNLIPHSTCYSLPLVEVSSLLEPRTADLRSGVSVSSSQTNCYNFA